MKPGFLKEADNQDFAITRKQKTRILWSFHDTASACTGNQDFHISEMSPNQDFKVFLQQTRIPNPFSTGNQDFCAHLQQQTRISNLVLNREPGFLYAFAHRSREPGFLLWNGNFGDCFEQRAKNLKRVMCASQSPLSHALQAFKAPPPDW